MTTGLHPKSPPTLLTEHVQMLICPVCQGDLALAVERLTCTACQRTYECDGEIPLLFWPNEWPEPKADVTAVVKSFYEEHPFPNYEQVDSIGTLRDKARQGVFARLLDDQTPLRGVKILEAGCGTGQLSNFLGASGQRAVFATDICLNSLRLGQAFKEQNQIDRVAFLQMNVFRPVFRVDSFDLVICNGVLHHTSDPFRGFQLLASLVKPGGFLIVGLYNRFGRVPTDIRRLLFRLSGNRLTFLDPRLRDKRVGDVRKQTWFLDQYQHPHESTHTLGEVLGWFDRTGFEFVNSIPKCTAFESFSHEEPLCVQHARGTTGDRFLVQCGMMLSGGREGGFFVMIGRKRFSTGCA